MARPAFTRLEAFRVGMLCMDQLTDSDRSELDRRANAYPKLIEALHLIIRSVGADVFALSKEQRRDMDKIRALLRNLGESA